jgi:CRP-like cAMP-binding protein
MVMFLTYPITNDKCKLQSSERRVHFYGRGEEIPLITQGIWQVNRGVVQLTKYHTNGDETLLGWAQTNNFFGLWLTTVEAFQAKALSDVYLQWYPLTEIETSAEISQAVLKQIVFRIQQTEELLAISGLKRVEEKLIAFFKLLSHYLGEEKDSKIRLVVRLTHQNIANAIGTTRVTVTRLLGDWQKQNLIAFDANRHLLIQPELIVILANIII